MIYTSYYSNYKKYSVFYRISISRNTPNDAADISLKFLAPDSSLLCGYKNGNIGEEEYARRYLSSLEELHDNGTLDKFAHYLINHSMDVVLMEDEIRYSCIDYVGDEYEQIDTSVLANAYENGVFDLIQKDEKYNLNHIFKTQFGAFRRIADHKLKQINAFINSDVAKDFREYWQLKSIVINPIDIYIYSNGRVFSFDEWLMSPTKRRTGNYDFEHLFNILS